MMNEDQQRFEDNMARFLDEKPNGDGDANVTRAVLAALDDIDSVSDDFAKLHGRFAFTQQELDEAAHR